MADRLPAAPEQAAPAAPYDRAVFLLLICCLFEELLRPLRRRMAQFAKPGLSGLPSIDPQPKP